MPHSEAIGRHFGLLLFAAGTMLIGCNQSRDLLPFQDQEIQGSALELRPYMGGWCDDSGELALAITGGTSPMVRMRLPEFIRLTDARFVEGELVVTFDGGDRPTDLEVKLVESNVAVIRPRGLKEEGPFTCGTCTPFLSRGVAACSGRRVAERLYPIESRARDAVEDFLVEHF